MENPFRKVITVGLIAGASLLPTEAKTQILYNRVPVSIEDKKNLDKYAEEYKKYEELLASGYFKSKDIGEFNSSIAQLPAYKKYGWVEVSDHSLWPKYIIYYNLDNGQVGQYLLPYAPVYGEGENGAVISEKIYVKPFTRERQPQEIGPASEKYDSKTGRVIPTVEDKKE